ncbi:hypothetical protein [Chitinimonas koreensis]|uniref:hypothetical protein n=1 Tax=Chitinimonas koreensis TaxID=356302 RepID=UPI0022405D4F|nr:hypothetical protein [Chitinimonas koreensis]
MENTTLLISNMPIHNHQAVFTGTPAAVTGGGSGTTVTIDVGTSASPALANPTNGGTTYLTAVTAATSGGDNVDFQGLYTTTAPAAGAKATLGGVTVGSGGGGGTVTATGTVTVGNNGGSLPFSIQQPYLGVTFIIALNGIFPSRN